MISLPFPSMDFLILFGTPNVVHVVEQSVSLVLMFEKLLIPLHPQIKQHFVRLS